MTDYIRRAEALEITTRTCGDYAAAWSEIRKLPAADVAPVVRCEDCEYAERYERTNGTAGYYCGNPKNRFTYGERWDRVFKSAQVLKANMRIVGATEFAVVLYRDKLPKFNNGRKIGDDGKPIRGTGHMIFDWFAWERDGKDVPKIHPTQKPVNVLKRLIEIFTDEGDVVIDPCCGSGSTLRAAIELGRSAFGFEIDRNFYNAAKEKMLQLVETAEHGNENQTSLF